MRDTNKRPNIIWIFGDQHRAQALSCNGDPNVRTPNIDNLAATGVNFSNAIAGYPLCCPFRGSLLTSRYPHKCVPMHQSQLPPEQQTIAHTFNDAGYDTAYVGKWHLDGFSEKNGRSAHHIVPPERRGGFKYWVGYENNNSPWDSWIHGGEDNNSELRRLPGFETDALTDLFIDYLKKQGKEQTEGEGQPFFAALSVQPPHNPFSAPADTMRNYSPESIKLRSNVPDVARVLKQAKSELPGYYAMIENLDRNVGKIRNALFEIGIADHTHIIFFSDHGDMMGSHGQFRKTSPYEESIRIPFIISGEQPHYEGRKVGSTSVPLNHVDIAPTTLGMCGINKPDWMEGTDYSSYRLAGRPKMEEPDSAFLQNIHPRGNVNKPWRGIVTDEGWKYICLEGYSYLMFNLQEDPYEHINLAHDGRFSDQRKKLIDRLSQWINDTDDQFVLPDF